MEEKISRISSLESHRNLLKMVFKKANDRILVVSPFISGSAISQDSIPELVSAAIRRGVTVDIFTDKMLNCDGNGLLKRAAATGLTRLAKAGANLCIVHGIHHKTLAMDKTLIAEGSFNWLSAVRSKGHEQQREERTLVYQGDKAREMIEKESKTMNERTQYFVHPKRRSRTSGFFRIAGLIAIGGIILSPLGIVWYFAGVWPAVILSLLYVAGIYGRNKQQDPLTESMVDPGLKGLPYNIHHKE